MPPRKGGMFLLSHTLMGKQTILTLQQCAEVAGYLWQKGWAERNGGNLLVGLSEEEILQLFRKEAIENTTMLPLGIAVPNLCGRYFYSKGTGCRFRNLALSPMDNGCILQISEDGKEYTLFDNGVRPTSELTAHLLIHNQMAKRGRHRCASLHSHPTTLVAMTHVERLLQQDLTALLWQQIPEARLFCPRGLAVAPYAEPGSNELAEATLAALQEHDLALWEKHGAMAVGDNIVEAFDTIDVMEKAAQIYLQACTMR